MGMSYNIIPRRGPTPQCLHERMLAFIYTYERTPFSTVLFCNELHCKWKQKTSVSEREWKTEEYTHCLLNLKHAASACSVFIRVISVPPHLTSEQALKRNQRGVETSWKIKQALSRIQQQQQQQPST